MLNFKNTFNTKSVPDLAEGHLDGISFYLSRVANLSSTFTQLFCNTFLLKSC